MSKGETARKFYESARMELITHIKLSNQAMFLFIAAAATIFTVAHSSSGNLNLLLVIPFIGVGATVITIQHDILSGGLASYCNKEIRSALEDIDQDIAQWDSSDFLNYYQPTLIKRRLLAHALVLLPPSFIAIYLNNGLSNGELSTYGVIWYVSIPAVVYSSWVIFSNFWSRHMAYEKSKI